jgi:hypothetical protein
MTEKKRVSFTVALAMADYELLVALAAHEERSMGDALRRCLYEKARHEGLLPQPSQQAMGLATNVQPA